MVNLSFLGYESFEEKDKSVIDWLKTQLLERLSTSEAEVFGSECYHLKGRGGIKQASQDLQSLLDSSDFPYIIRSDAKGYYAHIRHHKLVRLLKDSGYGRDVCHVTTQLCQRMQVRRGIYSECQQGIPLGCAASPALAAIYLSPLDQIMKQLPGVKYLRYMDDWVILCPSRWKMRKAVKLMHQTLASLGLHAHPDKTFIGKVACGFDFLGIQFQFQPQTHSPTLSQVSLHRLKQQLDSKFSSCTWLYEQGRLRNLETIKCYLTHWLSWAKGIGIAPQNSLAAIADILQALWRDTQDRMTQTFSRWIFLLLTKKTNTQ